MYKITDNLIAIPISDFLIALVRPSQHYYPLSYRLITATTDNYKFSFSLEAQTLSSYNQVKNPTSSIGIHVS